LVATADIPARTSGESIVANKLVERRELAASAVTPGALTSETQLQGQILTVPVVTRAAVGAVPTGSAGGAKPFPIRSRTGMRAISIAIDRRNAVGGAVKVGDRVDVIATIDAEEFKKIETQSTETTVAELDPLAPTTSSTLAQPSGMNLGMILSPAEVARIEDLTGLDLSRTVSSVSITILQQVDVLAVDNLLPVTARTGDGGSGVFGGGEDTTTQEVPDQPVITSW
jgi:hypothetical protein